MTPTIYIIGYDDKNKGEYCIIEIHAATDSIIARGFKTILAAKTEAKQRGLKITPNPYLKHHRAKR